MKKIIATITLALAAANAHALVNPNKVHVLSTWCTRYNRTSRTDL